MRHTQTPLVHRAQDAGSHSDRIRASALEGIAPTIEKYGGDPVALFEMFDIDPATASHDGAFISYASFTNLMEYCSQLLGRNHFGLDVAEYMSPAVFGPIAVLMEASSTVKESINYLQVYFHAHAPQNTLTLTGGETDGLSELRFMCMNPDLAHKRQVNEQGAASLFKILSVLRGERLPLEYVCLAADPPVSGITRVCEYFGCEVLYQQSVNALAFPSAFLLQPLQKRNQWLADIVLEQLDPYRFDDNVSLSGRVEQMVDHLLPLGCCNVVFCSEQLGLTPRTLQWQLKESGTSFMEIVTRRRSALAQAYLRDTKLPLSAIASVLGYADQATFTRAFRQWSTLPPAKFRRLSRLNQASEDGRR